MNLLLDTHVAPVGDHGQSETAAEGAWRDRVAQNDGMVSAASVWEIAIKHALGRGDMPVSSQDAVRYFQESGYRILPIEAEHVVAVESSRSKLINIDRHVEGGFQAQF